MTWLNPWGWAGLTALALPVLIHLLGQDPAVRQRFPTLRFFGATRALPTTRRRIHELVLLIIRCGIFAAAVAALAQPLFRNAARRHAADDRLVRAIIVDTSASMQGQPNGGAAALQHAQRLGDSADAHLILTTARPAAAIAGAASWLARQNGRSEMVIISDFQVGTIDGHDLAALPASVGVQLIPVPLAAVASPIDLHTSERGGTVVAHVTLAPAGSQVEWQSDPSAHGRTTAPITLRTGPDERAGAAAAEQAARTSGVSLPLDATRAIAIVYPHAVERISAIQHATPLSSPWMAAVVAQLSRDPQLISAVQSAVVEAASDSAALLVVVRTSAGRPAVLAAADTASNVDGLLLFPLTPPGSITSAALIAATTRALSLAPPASEHEPNVIADSVLAKWQRAPATAGNSVPDGESDGRYFWMIALLLLALESIVRRATAAPRSTESGDVVTS